MRRSAGGCRLAFAGSSRSAAASTQQGSGGRARRGRARESRPAAPCGCFLRPSPEHTTPRAHTQQSQEQASQPLSAICPRLSCDLCLSEPQRSDLITTLRHAEARARAHFSESPTHLAPSTVDGDKGRRRASLLISGCAGFSAGGQSWCRHRRKKRPPTGHRPWAVLGPRARWSSASTEEVDRAQGPAGRSSSLRELGGMERDLASARLWRTLLAPIRDVRHRLDLMSSGADSRVLLSVSTRACPSRQQHRASPQSARPPTAPFPSSAANAPPSASSGATSGTSHCLLLLGRRDRDGEAIPPASVGRRRAAGSPRSPIDDNGHFTGPAR